MFVQNLLPCSRRIDISFSLFYDFSLCACQISLENRSFYKEIENIELFNQLLKGFSVSLSYFNVEHKIIQLEKTCALFIGDGEKGSRLTGDRKEETMSMEDYVISDTEEEHEPQLPFPPQTIQTAKIFLVKKNTKLMNMADAAVKVLKVSLLDLIRQEKDFG